MPESVALINIDRFTPVPALLVTVSSCFGNAIFRFKTVVLLKYSASNILNENITFQIELAVISSKNRSIYLVLGSWCCQQNVDSNKFVIF